MAIDMGVVIWYIYPLITIGFFLYHWRNWTFIRVTLLYFIVLTFFGCLVVYGSAFALESHPSQWQGILAAFPFTFSNGMPDANAVPKNSSTYWLWTVILISFFVTFPQAVVRGTRLHPGQGSAPKTIMEKLINKYHSLQPVFAWIGKVWPHLRPHVLGTVSTVFSIGEWIFVLMMLGSVAAPVPVQSWPLMLVGSFFVVLLAGTEIVSGFGLISLVLKFVIPGIIGAMQKFAAFMMSVFLFLLCLPIAFISGSILLAIAQDVLHINHLSLIGILIIVFISIGIFFVCLTLLSKIILFPITKLIEWMEIEIIDGE